MSHPYLPFLQRQLIIAFLGLLGGCGVEAKTWQGWWISEGLCRLLGRRLRPNSPGRPPGLPPFLASLSRWWEATGLEPNEAAVGLCTGPSGASGSGPAGEEGAAVAQHQVLRALQLVFSA